MEIEFRRLLEYTLQDLGGMSLEGGGFEDLSDRELAELYALWLKGAVLRSGPIVRCLSELQHRGADREAQPASERGEVQK